MEKVFIVYSDCCCGGGMYLEGVFTDADIAKEYAEVVGGEVEEYGIMDEVKFCLKIRIECEKPLPGFIDRERISVKIKKDVFESQKPWTKFENKSGNSHNMCFLYAERFVDADVDIEELRECYRKAAIDIMDYCIAQKANGFSDEEINEFLESKFERGKIK